MLAAIRQNALRRAHDYTEWACRRIGHAVVRGPGRRRSVALTFDDGPSPGTLILLEDLARLGVRATFFQCGLNVRRHPEIARAVLSAGHQIGNHSYSHARLAPRPGWRLNWHSPRFVVEEFDRAQAVFESVLAYAPSVMRVPYGLPWFGTGAAARRHGLTGILWTVIGHDWEWPAERVAGHVLQAAAPGAILCLHDGRDVQPMPDIETTLRAVRQIVPELQARGYAFETVSDLLRPDGAPANGMA